MAAKNTAKKIETKDALIDPATGKPAAPTNPPVSDIDASTGMPSNPSNSPVDAPASRDRTTKAGAGVKPVGTPDKGSDAKDTPELPVIDHPDKESFADESGDAADDAEADRTAPAKKAKPGGKGFVTYRFKDGSTVTNDVDDVNNPPALKSDEHGEAEVVKE